MIVLQRWLAHLMKQPPRGVVSVLQLFFDGYSEDMEAPEVLVPFDVRDQ